MRIDGYICDAADCQNRASERSEWFLLFPPDIDDLENPNEGYNLCSPECVVTWSAALREAMGVK